MNAGALAVVDAQHAELQPSAICVTGDYVERDWAAAAHDGMEAHRNSVIIAHRRAGKTVCVIAQAIRDVFACKAPEPQAAYIAPTAKQARTVSWPYFRRMLGHIPGVNFREHQQQIDLPNGGRILIASGEQYDRLRGLYLDCAIVDEAADCPDALITKVLMPALLDRDGKLILIGTVKGRGPFWRMYEKALESPDWYAARFLPSDTGVIPPDALARIRGELSESEYAQEFLCDPSAAIKGAYWARELRQAEEDGRVCRVPHDPRIPVTVALDLGMADSTAIWIAQLHTGGEIRLLEYREYQNTSFVQILRELEALPYRIAHWVGPHDLRVREYTSGQSRMDAAAELGIIFDVAPRLPVIEGIEAVRVAIPRMVFDASKCRAGLDALALYRSKWDETHRVLSRNPVHDWTSHGADALRYLITGTGGGQANIFTRMGDLDYGD